MPSPWFDYRSTRGRVLLYVSDAWIVAAGVIFAVVVGKHWAWGPFVLGPILGAVGLGANMALMWFVIRVVRPSEAEMQRAKPRQRQWYLVTIPGYVTFGLVAGLVSAGIPSYWPDIVFAAMILLMGIVVPLALLPWLKRKGEAMRAKPD